MEGMMASYPWGNPYSGEETPWGNQYTPKTATSYGSGSVGENASGDKSISKKAATTSEPANTAANKDSWIDWVRLAIGAYQSMQKPKFENVPLSPELKKMYDMYIQSLMNPDLKGLASDTAKRSTEILNGYQKLGWNSPETFSGQFGYQGSRTNTGLSPIPGGAPTPDAANRGQALRDANFQGGPSGGFGQRKFNRTWEPAFPGDVGGPGDDESIYGRMTRDPGYIGNERDFPTTGGPYDPNRPVKPGEKPIPVGGGVPGNPETRYGTPGDLMGFTDFLRSQGVKDAAKIALGFIGGGLGGAAFASAKVLWDRWQASKSGGKL